MKAIKIISLILCLIFVSAPLFSCNKENTDMSDTQAIESISEIEEDNKEDTTVKNTTNNTPTNTPSSNDKEKVIDMFITKGEYIDGAYYIRKYTETGDCSFVYSFAYDPKIDLFYCATLVTTYSQNYTLYDNGAISFAWGDFKNALTTGYHQLKNVAMIEFDYVVSNPKSNMSFGNYKYSVYSNSFKNLTSTTDINAYAETCFKCVNQGLAYAQSILSGYLPGVTLW